MNKSLKICHKHCKNTNLADISQITRCSASEKHCLLKRVLVCGKNFGEIYLFLLFFQILRHFLDVNSTCKYKAWTSQVVVGYLLNLSLRQFAVILMVLRVIIG